MKGSAIVTIVYSLYSWRGLLITGSVMSEAAGRVSVVGLRRLPFILNGNTTRRVVLKETFAPVLAFRILFATSD